jgi:two-component system CheB/CheR fusion protein
VNKALREPIVFASQSLISDAPCSRSDRVSCPNLLASLEPEFQQKLIPPFHFALNESGYLLLGPAESIGPAADLFEPVSKRWRVYRRIGPARPKRVNIPTAPAGERRPPIPAGGADFVRKLEHQLKGTHEDLQGTMEELEASKEESCR